jgi:hypothetical protein
LGVMNKEDEVVAMYAFVFVRTNAMSPFGPELPRRASAAVSSVDGSRIARGKLARWHWSDAVFCPAC